MKTKKILLISAMIKDNDNRTHSYSFDEKNREQWIVQSTNNLLAIYTFFTINKTWQCAKQHLMTWCRMTKETSCWLFIRIFLLYRHKIFRNNTLILHSKRNTIHFHFYPPLDPYLSFQCTTNNKKCINGNKFNFKLFTRFNNFFVW